MKVPNSLSYTWTVIKCLFTTIVAYGIVSKFSAPFERVVIDVLVLLYLAAENFFTATHVMWAAEPWMAKLNRLGIDPETLLTDEKTLYTKTMITTFIKWAFGGIIYVFTLWNLVTTLTT